MTLRSRARNVITVGVITGGSTNDYGDLVPTYTDTAVPAWVRQSSSSEDNVDRETRSRLWNVLVDATTWDALSADATSRVVLEGGETTRILGEPALFSGHRGPHHYEFTVEEVLG